MQGVLFFETTVSPWPILCGTNHHLQFCFSYTELFKGTVLKRTIIGLFIQSAQQFTGINGVLYYAPSIFQLAGLSGTTNSLVATGATGICNFAATIPAVIWIDRWGRKPTLISGAIIQAIAMFVIGGLFQTQSTFVDGNLVINSAAATNTIIAFIFIFTLAFAYSWGACGFIYPAEIFPMRVRAKVKYVRNRQLFDHESLH